METKLRLVVITPVGPGHEEPARAAVASVHAAHRGPFDEVHHEVVFDLEGRLGRSRARNLGMDRWPTADWFFFLDADDRMMPNALVMNDFECSATFGAICLDGLISSTNVFPCGWIEIGHRGAAGTLSMGFFCRADVARGKRFNEATDAGEDFEFYMRLKRFTKRRRPLVDIGRSIPSAGGPRGYVDLDWTHICNVEVLKAWKNDPAKFGVDHHAVLAKARSRDRELDQLARALFRERAA